MYKSKLQEYCQTRAWLLPEYSTTKEGYDHRPRFKASVIVNGSTFFTPDFSKSSKDAQNLVAKIAFYSLTGSSSASPASHVSATPSTLQQPEPSEPVQATPLSTMNPTNWDDNKLKGSSSASPASHVSATPSTLQQPEPSDPVQATPLSTMNPTNWDDNKLKDMAHLYKNQLQIYTQKRNVNLPVYVSEREGPPHAPRFKSKVMLEGKTYECQEYFCTIKDAENGAAKIALMSVSSVEIQEENPSFFKNLLQELAQKDYSCLPEYNTTSSGPSHSPIFISTVEIKDVPFIGEAAKTKKLAEMHAAKVAYSALKERKLKQESKLAFPGSHVAGSPHCSSSMVQSVASAEVPQRTILAPNIGSNEASVEHTIFTKGAYQKISEPKPNIMQHEGIQKFDQNNSGLKVDDMPFSRSPSYSPAYPGWDQPPSSSVPIHINKPSADPHALSAHKKIKVFPREPNMTLPPGATIKHEDERWVSVEMDSIHGNA